MGRNSPSNSITKITNSFIFILKNKMSITSLTYQYQSSSYQSLVQHSASGELFNGLGDAITNLDVNATTATTASHAVQSLSSSYANYASSTTLAASALMAFVVRVDNVDDNKYYNVVFTEGSEMNLAVRADSSSLKYNPSADRLYVSEISSSTVYGELIGTASFSETASYATTAISTSYSENSTNSLSSSFAETASYASNSLKIENNINNYLLTASGSNTIYGEQKLQFNGTKLTVNGELFNGWHTATPSIGLFSHVEGYISNAPGEYAHAEGSQNSAVGEASHAEGQLTTANGLASHAEGLFTIADADYQHVQGMYNKSSSNKAAFIIGNGKSDANRSNLLYASGSIVEITGSLKVTQSITGSLLGMAEVTNAIPFDDSVGWVNTPGMHVATGSLYFDVVTSTLYIFNGTVFKSASFF